MEEVMQTCAYASLHETKLAPVTLTAQHHTAPPGCLIQKQYSHFNTDLYLTN